MSSPKRTLCTPYLLSQFKRLPQSPLIIYFCKLVNMCVDVSTDKRTVCGGAVLQSCGTFGFWIVMVTSVEILWNHDVSPFPNIPAV